MDIIDNTVEFNEKYSLISSYEPKIFLDDEREKYLIELKDEILAEKDRKDHFISEIHLLRDGKETIKRFIYDKNFEKGILIEIDTCNQKIENTKEFERKLDEEAIKLDEEQKEQSEKSGNIEKILNKINNQKDMFRNYIEKNKNYMQQWKEYNDLIKKKKALGTEINSDETEKIRLTDGNSQLSEKRSTLTYKLEDINKKLMRYLDVSEGSLILGTPEELEKEYQVLIDKQGQSINDIEEKILYYRNELDTKSSELSFANVEPNEYEGVLFDSIKYASILKEINILLVEVDKKQEQFNKASSNFIRADERFKLASKDLNKLSMSKALDKDEIKGNFDNRRNNICFELNKLTDKENEYNKNKNLYIRFKDLISTIIDIDRQLSLASFSLKEDVEQQFKELKSNFESTKKNYDKSKNEYRKLFNSIKNRYEGKHQSITDIVNSVDTLDIDESTYDRVYYYFEELAKKRESLSKFLTFYEQQLMNIEHTKNQVIDQCVGYAVLIYEDIKSITDKSRVKLSGKNKTVKMLKIDIPDKMDDYARKRMEEYITSSVKIMADIYESSKDDNIKKCRDKIRGIVSTRELLNQFIGSSKIPVSVYKVDLNESNSGLKRWEDAISENSGGEKFVVFFTLVSVLISYTRDATLRSIGQDITNESKVIIMDNPFGKTSSEHLLKAIIDIAETFNIQLICLSDLSQSSITNRFDLIFRLSIRKRMYSDTEVLKIQDLTINKQGLSEDERLEHAMIYQTAKQENIFDLFDIL